MREGSIGRTILAAVIPPHPGIELYHQIVRTHTHTHACKHTQYYIMLDSVGVRDLESHSPSRES